MVLDELYRQILGEIGEDPKREGLVKTPQRAADALRFMTQGYQQDVCAVLNGAIFEEPYEDMVIIRDIEFYSLCEHHILPFFGKAHIAYLPNGRIVGISKLARLVEVYARRLHVQERMTNQIATTISEQLGPLGVGVVLEAEHLCMRMRGVEKQNSTVLTSAMLGVFRDRETTRAEFMTLIGRR